MQLWEKLKKIFPVYKEVSAMALYAIMKDINRGNLIFREKAFHFRGGAPPVIMVSLQNQLFPVAYSLVAADFLGFVPKKILD